MKETEIEWDSGSEMARKENESEQSVMTMSRTCGLRK